MQQDVPSAALLAMLERFDIALSAPNAALRALRAQTYLLFLVRRHVELLDGRQTDKMSFWPLVRVAFQGDAYRQLRADIGTIVNFRNTVAHDLRIGLAPSTLRECCLIAGMPECQDILKLADDIDSLPKRRMYREAATAIRDAVDEGVVSLAVFEVMSRALVAVMEQQALLGHITPASAAIVADTVKRHTRNRRANLRRGASLMRRAFAYATMKVPRVGRRGISKH